MKEWKCNGCEQHHEIKSENHPQYCIDFGIANYHNWCEMNEGKLPKLTAEELEKRGIKWPEWADGAVVHSDESASFYCNETINVLYTPGYKADWYVDGIAGKFENIPGKWDASDWKNSLIKRPEKQTVIPDWCKVGAWVFETTQKMYHKIMSIKETNVVMDSSAGKDYRACSDVKWLQEARLIMWSKSEWESKIGQKFQLSAGQFLLLGCIS